MRIALLTNDNREIQRKYHLSAPLIGMAPESLLDGLGTLGDEVEVHVVSCLQRPPVSSPEKLAPNTHYHPLIVPKLGWLKTGYQGCIRAVRHALQRIKPDIVHGQGTERDCAISAVFSGYPNVLTVHGHMSRIAAITRAHPLSFYWLAARLERFSLRRTHGVIAISNYSRELVAGDANRTWVVHNAVDPSFFDVESRPADPPRILCVANVSPWKNQIGLIEALEPLAREESFELRFAGGVAASDSYGAAFLERVRTRSWCKLAGKLERPQLQEELAAATMVVLPSFEDNCPMVVLESAAAGVPVAASRIGGIPDLLRDGETGLLFDPAHPAEIRAAVERLLKDRVAAGRSAARARQEARVRFSIETVARRHVEIYREVLTCH
ncbi:MAG: glycosyltransferase family 4 protein [Chthoniobacterales bacterium]